MTNLIKKNLTPFLMLLCGVGMTPAFGLLWGAVFFCGVICPTVNVVLGKKYAIPFAVLGVVWLVIAIIMNWT